MAVNLPIGPLKPATESRYRDANPVPANSLADDITTASSGSVKKCCYGRLCDFIWRYAPYSCVVKQNKLTFVCVFRRFRVIVEK